MLIRGLSVGVFAALVATGPVAPAASAMQDTLSMPERGWIGIRFTSETTPSPSVLRESFQLLVADVYPNSPADLTGIVPGDWFVSVDGNPLSTHETWMRSTSNMRAGQSIRLVLMRNGDQREVTVVADPAPAFVLPNPLDEFELAVARFDSVFEDFLRLPRGADLLWQDLPGITFHREFGIDATMTVTFGDPESATGSVVFRTDGDGSEVRVSPQQEGVEPESPPSAGGGGTGVAGELDRPGQNRLSLVIPQLEGTILFGGVLVRDLTSELGRYFGVEKGVWITDVFPMSPGRQAGFRAGDVVISVEGKTVENVRGFRGLLVELSTPIELTVVRRKEPVKIVFPRPPG